MFIRIKFRLILDQLKVIRKYYKNGRFAIVDLCLLALYLFSNPYRMCRKFLQKKNVKDIYAYGETPLTTLEKMVRAFSITSNDRWLELGSGRGRSCFWMHLFWGSSARGVEWVPSFVSRASFLVRLFSLETLDFQKKSMFEADFTWPSVVFLYSTCMSEGEIISILLAMNTLPEGAKVITISEALQDENYVLTNRTAVSFPWGETDAYLHTKSTRFQSESLL